MLPEGEPGIIVAIDGDRVRVRLTDSEACDKCGLKVVCRPGQSGSRELELPYQQSLEVGQAVKLVEAVNLEWRLTAIQYVLPLLLFIAGLLVCYFLFPAEGAFPREAAAFLGGLVGLTISYFSGRSMMTRMAKGSAQEALKLVPLRQR